MKAIIDQDIIVAVHQGDTEIGELPRDVGLERLRWDGAKVVDLDALSEIWVEPRAGGFRLHAVEVPGAKLVAMTYRDRRLLKLNGSAPRVKTSDEIAAELAAKDARRRLAELERRQSERIGDLSQRVLTLYKLLGLLIVWSRTQAPALQQLLDELVPIVRDIFPREKFADQVKADLAELKQIMDDFYSKQGV